MGLFSKKDICIICGEEVGKKKISEGYICLNCLDKCKMYLPSNKTMGAITSKDVVEGIRLTNNNIDLFNEFKPTKKNGYIQIDDDNKLWIIHTNGKSIPRVYRYKDILSFELLEDGETITKGGVGRAIAGGVLFGGVGAVIGGVTGGKKTKSIINSLKIKITVRNISTPVVYINFLATKTKSTSFLYRTAYNSAQEILSILSLICDENKQNENIELTTNNNFISDELIKLKKLLDDGILTETEFKEQKQKLLL